MPTIAAARAVLAGRSRRPKKTALQPGMRPTFKAHQPSAPFRRGLAVALAATLANPLTIVSWAAAFTAVVPELSISRVETLSVLPLSVSLGTLTWFTILAAAATLFGRRLGPRALRTASVVAGVAIALFGVVFVARGLGA